MIFTISSVAIILGYIVYALAKPSPLEAWAHMCRTGHPYGSWWIGAGRLLMLSGAVGMLVALGMLAWRWLP